MNTTSNHATSDFVEYDVEPRYVRFQFGERAPGHTKLLDKDDALPALREIYRRYTADGSGLLHRGDELWQLMFRAPPNQKLYAAVYYDPDEVPTAYCIYRSKWQELDTTPEADQVLEVFDFGWIDIDGYRGIWEYLAGHDLANRIRWYRVPEDDPAPAMMLEPRMLQRRTGDGIWLRIVDVEDALRARGYDWPGEVTLGVVNDDICSWNDGCYRVASGGAECALRVRSVSSRSISCSRPGVDRPAPICSEPADPAREEADEIRNALLQHGPLHGPGQGDCAGSGWRRSRVRIRLDGGAYGGPGGLPVGVPILPGRQNG